MHSSSSARNTLLLLLSLLLANSSWAQDEATEQTYTDPFPGVMFSQDVTVSDTAPVAKSDPAPFQPLRLVPTTLRTGKRTIMLTAFSATKSDTEASEDNDGNRVKSFTRHTYIRLKLKQAQAHGTTQNVAVVLQTFTKDVGAEGALVPIESAVALANITELDAAATWLDFPMIETGDKKTTKRRVSSGSPQSSSDGTAFLGVVVTVFNATNIVFQEASLGSLKDLGITSIPGGPREPEKKEK